MKKSETNVGEAAAAAGQQAAAAAAAASHGAAELGARVDELRENAAELGDSLSEASQDVAAFVRQQTRVSPYRSLGVAAGLGFLLGGGLTPQVSGALLRLGGRLAVGMITRDILKTSAVD